MGDMSGFGATGPKPVDIVGMPIVTSSKGPMIIIDARQKDREDFISRAMFAINSLARSQTMLTADDVWSYLGGVSHLFTRDPRLLGVAMRKAQKDGIIIPSNSYKQSMRKSINHGRRIMIWYSQVWGKNERKQTSDDV